MAETPPESGAAQRAAPKQQQQFLIGGAIIVLVDDVAQLWDEVKAKLSEGVKLSPVFKLMWQRVSMHLTYHGQQLHEIEKALAKLSPEFRKHLQKRDSAAAPPTTNGSKTT